MVYLVIWCSIVIKTAHEPTNVIGLKIICLSCLINTTSQMNIQLGSYTFILSCDKEIKIIMTYIYISSIHNNYIKILNVATCVAMWLLVAYSMYFAFSA